MLAAVVISVLLLIGGIESNPGPSVDEKLDAIMLKLNLLESVEENVKVIKTQFDVIDAKVKVLESQITNMDSTIKNIEAKNSSLLKKLNLWKSRATT